MGFLRTFFRDYKRRTKKDCSLLLDVFHWHRVLNEVQVRFKTLVTNSHKIYKVPGYMPEGIVFSTTIAPGESVQAAYLRAAVYMATNYAIYKTQRKGRHLVVPAAETPLEVNQLISAANNLHGNNSFRVVVRPPVEWIPRFNFPIPNSRLIDRAFTWGVLHDRIYVQMFSSHPHEYEASKSLVRDYGGFGRSVVIRPKLPSLQYLCYEQLLKSNPHHSPFYIQENSFVTGSSAKGLLDCVGKMMRDVTKPNVPVRHIKVALMRINQKFTSKKKTALPDLSPAGIDSIKDASEMSGGLNLHNPVSEEVLDGIVIKNVNQYTKREGEFANKATLIRVIEAIRRDARKAGFEYRSSYFEPIRILSKMSIKAEAREPGADPDKQRVIFVVSSIKTLLDRVIYTPIMKRLYSIGANGIKTKFNNGGAARFAWIMGAVGDVPIDKFYGRPPPRTERYWWNPPPPGDPYKSNRPWTRWGSGAHRSWVSLDISKFDQSVMASLLLMVLLYPLTLYDPKDPNYYAMEVLYQWSVENSVAKVVKWFGDEWRILWGLMFSGELMTSLGDSLYLEIVFECFDIWLYEKVIKGTPDEERYKRAKRVFKDYGDDGSLMYLEWIMRLVLDEANRPKLLQVYLAQAWSMELKLADTYVNMPADPRPDPEIPCFFTQLVSRGVGPFDIAYKGAKYLKRYFVIYPNSRGTEYILPYRPTVDYFMKAVCIAGNNLSDVQHIIRLRALALDTMGTNPRAHNFLEKAHEFMAPTEAAKDRVSQAVSRILGVMMNNEECPGWSVEDRNLFNRVGGPLGARICAMGFPDPHLLLNRACWSNEHQQGISSAARSRVTMNSEELMDYDW